MVKIYTMLGSSATRKRLFGDVRLKLFDGSFVHKLNSKSGIVALQNGVYDLHEGIVREPVPSDYASIRAPTLLLDPIPQHKLSKLMGVLEKIFPEPELLDFFIMTCASFLEGYNSNKIFYIWWGKGNNAKTAIQTLVAKTFGNYCATLPTTLITRSRGSSSNATPDMCHLEGKLVMFLQEPNSEEKIKGGVVKELTGNDNIYIRELYKQPRSIKIKGKMILVCNNILDIPDIDAALKRRTIVIPFLSTFLPKREFDSLENQNKKYTYLVEPNAEKILEDSCDEFMSLLLREYPRYLKCGLQVPKIISDTIDTYLVAHNYPVVFKRKYFKIQPGTNMEVREIYGQFKSWFKDVHPSHNIPTLEKFANALNLEWDGVLEDIFVSYDEM
ncbi:hypothetical protein K7432_018057 [Basidiobolus ranarum]|uniref:SF3 helicase domain-containing protein n=1 Tax=Basidiobolus ranarum TaxID=34480 RepID=A0ABR2VJJ5_9FUNG